MLNLDDLYSMQGKVCLVTGGSTGLGSYMAEGFLAAGAARVYITARTESTLQAKADELTSSFEGECIGVTGDLATMDGVAALASHIHQNEQHLDVLVNNAGLGSGGYFGNLLVEDWDKSMDLNLRTPFFLTQALLDLLKKNASLENPARVIFISSVAASEVFAHVMAYSTSKKGLEHLTPQLALALCDDHILVNAISPGRFFSEMTRGAWEDPEDEAYLQSLERIPAHRYGGLEDIAGVAVMLCSRAGAYFTGEVLNLDGGHRFRH